MRMEGMTYWTDQLAEFVTLYGDAGGDMSGYAVGGNDTLIGGTGQSTIIGDAGGNMLDHAHGGNDVLTAIGADISPLLMFGDSQQQMSGFASGGNDTLTVSGSTNLPEALYGDAFTMTGNAHGGNDILKTDGSLLSGANSAFLYGDAYSMFDNAVGGNDTLIGGKAGTSDTLVGDAHDMHGNATAGNDILISGGADDSMYGDAINKDASVISGHDTFVFAPMNGHDTINDFVHGNDIIDLTALASTGVHSISDLTIDLSGTDSIIHFDVNDTIAVVGIQHLLASDFHFA